MDKIFSDREIGVFLDGIRKTKKQLRAAEAAQEEAELQIFDLLHALELGTYDAVSMVRLAKLLKQARQARRQAKDTEERLRPVVQWLDHNPGAMKALDDLLGEERRIQKK